jgi:Mg/Co/Ni transporter MgtE
MAPCLAVWAFYLLLRTLKKSNATHKSFAVTLARIISVATLLACGVGVFVYILQPVSRFAGTFFDYRFHTDYWPNAWAEFLLLSLPLLCWSLFLRRNRDLVKITDTELFRGIVLGFVLGCFFLSFSRGGIIALGLEVIIFMAFSMF